MTGFPRDMPLTLENLEQHINGMTPSEKQELITMAKGALDALWLPQIGPQYDACHSEADELLYGGAAGGGKTDLICGLALTMHQRSLIFRRYSNDLDSIWDRLQEIGLPNMATNNQVKKVMVMSDGRKIEGGHLEKPGSEKSWQGRPHDLIAFDEGVQLEEYKVMFVTRWLRSTTPGQRKRVIFATNPPIPEYIDGQLVDQGVGEWLIRWFAPWLDHRYPNPAKQGELRWCYMISEGDRFTSVWVPGPGKYDPATGEHMPNATEQDVEDGRVMEAKSRTFIRSLMKDNAYLRNTGYAAQLSSTPEPLRTLLLTGEFGLKLEDHPQQVIPTAWVVAAQERWNEREHELRHGKRKRQIVLSGDVAQGGADTFVLAPLLEEDIYDELVAVPGRDVPDGKAGASLIFNHRRDQSLIVLDGTGGWAGATMAALEANHNIEAEVLVASAKSMEYTPDLLWQYGNNRAQMWWEFRLALDPQSPYKIALPPNTRLSTQLTTPHWYLRGKTLFVESKDEIRKRLQGASTDEADAVLQAWRFREQAVRAIAAQPHDIVEAYNRRPEDDTTNPNAAAPEDYDPLGNW